MKSQIGFDTARGAGKTLAQILGVYVKSAYPPGGSECTQATRSSLLQLAERIKDKAVEEEIILLRRRQLPLLRNAVEWYFSEVQPDMNSVREALLERLE